MRKKVWKFEQNYGKRSSIKAYQQEEQKEIEITHTNPDHKGSTWHWLKSYGLTSWAIEETV